MAAAELGARTSDEGSSAPVVDDVAWGALGDDVVVFDAARQLTHRLQGGAAEGWRQVVDATSDADGRWADRALVEMGLRPAGWRRHSAADEGFWRSLTAAAIEGAVPIQTSGVRRIWVPVAGHRLPVWSDDPDVLQWLERVLRATPEPGRSAALDDVDLLVQRVEDEWRISWNHALVQSLFDGSQCVAFLHWFLNGWAASLGALPGETLVHGCANGSETSAVLVVGPSGAGKSTLSAGLAHSGTALICDEMARLGSSRSIVGHGCSLSLDTDSLRVLGLAEEAGGGGVVPADVVGPVLAAPSRVDVVVDVNYDPTGPPAALTPIDPWRTLELLLSAGFDPSGRSIDDFLRLLDVAARAPAMHLEGSDLGAMVREVQQLLAELG